MPELGLLIVAGYGEASSAVIAASTLIVLGSLIAGRVKREPVPEPKNLH
ncbi:MAG: hypothetical protein ACTHYN_14485 [Marinobacter sp.]